MKKTIFFALLLAVCMVGTCAFALALPPEISKAFSDESWEGWRPVVVDEETAAGKGNPWAAVIMHRGDRNVLCILEKPDADFEIVSMSGAAVYGGNVLPVLEFESSEQDIPSVLMYAYTFRAPRLEETYRVARDENQPGTWQMMNIVRTEVRPQGVHHTVSLDYYRMYLLYAEAVGLDIHTSIMFHNDRLFGAFPRRFANFDINTYDRTMDDARAQLGGLPALAPGQQQHPLPAGMSVQLAADSKIDVYTGPGRQYARTVGGVVGPESNIQALALCGNYAFVAYADQDGPARFGYLPINALRDVTVPDAQFAYNTTYVLQDTAITNIPAGTSSMGTLHPGEQVLYLATLGSDWSYVEVGGPQPTRGFVRSEHILVDYDMEVPMDGSDIPGATAIVVRDVLMIDDPYRRPARQTVGTLQAGNKVTFYDTLYGEWAYVGINIDGVLIRGFIPRDAVASTDGYPLEGNG